MRKSTEELDHLEIRAAITALRTGAFRIARHGAKQSDRAALVGEVLAVVERHIEEAAPHQRHEPVETAFERAVGCEGQPCLFSTCRWVCAPTRANADQVPASCRNLHTSDRCQALLLVAGKKVTAPSTRDDSC